MNLITSHAAESKGAVFLGNLRSRQWHGSRCTGGLQSLHKTQGVETGLGGEHLQPAMRQGHQRKDRRTEAGSGQGHLRPWRGGSVQSVCSLGAKPAHQRSLGRRIVGMCPHQWASGLGKNGTGSKAKAMQPEQCAAVSELHSSCGRATSSEIDLVPKGCEPMQPHRASPRGTFCMAVTHTWTGPARLLVLCSCAVEFSVIFIREACVFFWHWVLNSV